MVWYIYSIASHREEGAGEKGKRKEDTKQRRKRNILTNIKVPLHVIMASIGPLGVYVNRERQLHHRLPPVQGILTPSPTSPSTHPPSFSSLLFTYISIQTTSTTVQLPIVLPSTPRQVPYSLIYTRTNHSPSPPLLLVVSSTVESISSPLHSLTRLSFRRHFNLPVASLPVASLLPTLVHLTFGDCFNQSVTALPKRLSHITSGSRFMQSVAFDLPQPPHLLCAEWIQANSQHSSLITHQPHFSWRMHSNSQHSASAPRKSHRRTLQSICDTLLLSLAHLTWIPFNHPVSPLSLTSLLVRRVLVCMLDQQVNTLPASLPSLSPLETYFNQPVTSLPLSLTSLLIRSTFKHCKNM